MFQKRLFRFLDRPDVKESFFSAVFKRISWRLHWMLSKDAYEVPFSEKSKIQIPKSGSGSLIYYQGFSEPETADFFHHFVKKGAVIIDIGAHIGEYTLLSAELAGSSGAVHAFEAQPAMFSVLSKNVVLNQLSNVTVNGVAVSNKNGQVQFELHNEPSVSSIRKPAESRTSQNIITVPAVTLDSYCAQHSLDSIDLIKVDVEGAEMLVFSGAEKLMSLPGDQTPTWIFEYAPSAYDSFGYSADTLLKLLYQYDYEVLRYGKGGHIRSFSPDEPSKGIINLVATKNKAQLAQEMKA